MDTIRQKKRTLPRGGNNKPGYMSISYIISMFHRTC